MPDRTVHGKTSDGVFEIVRYDRAGKWYLEEPGGQKKRIGVGDAARLAATGEFYGDRPGGQVFDARVRSIRHGSEQ